MTDTETEPETVTYQEMRRLGISGRQVDYWTRQSYLFAVEPKPGKTGSGHRRRWPVSEREIARLMARMISAGLSVEVAAKAAREAIESGTTEAAIAEGIVITWEQVPA